jgi:hypothetical protein
MKPTLLVLAAGMGSRYGGVKQIDPVGPAGEAIIDYSIYDAIRAGYGRIVFVVRKEIEADVRDFFAGKFDDRIDVAYVHQDLSDLPAGFSVPEGRTKPWGTCHAVLAARDVIDAPFAVINGDDFYGRQALATMARYLTDLPVDGTDYAMVGYRLARTLSQNGTVSRGIVTHDSGGWLESIEEHTKLKGTDDVVVSLTDDGETRATFDGSEATSMNLFGFTPAAMAQFGDEFATFLAAHGGEPKSEFYIPYAMNRLKEAERARMKVLRSDSEWFGVTYREDRPEVVARIRALVDAGIYPDSLWQLGR